MHEYDTMNVRCVHFPSSVRLVCFPRRLCLLEKLNNAYMCVPFRTNARRARRIRQKKRNQGHRQSNIEHDEGEEQKRRKIC